MLHQWGQHFETVRVCLSMCETSRRVPLTFSYLEHHSKAGRTLVIVSRGPDSILTLLPTCYVDQGPFFSRRTGLSSSTVERGL